MRDAYTCNGNLEGRQVSEWRDNDAAVALLKNENEKENKYEESVRKKNKNVQPLRNSQTDYTFKIIKNIYKHSYCSLHLHLQLNTII